MKKWSIRSSALREVDPLENKISDQSPIGKALIGTKVGDIISVEVPDGVAKFKVMKIEKKDS